MAARPSSSTHGEPLVAVIGSGSGIVNVTPTASVDGSFSAQINVSVHGAPPNTTFYVQRAPEVGRANHADGVCQRAAGLPPWGPPAPNFVTFPQPASGPLVTLETSAGGGGSVHIDFAAATIADGTQFDVMFRLVDNLTSPANELRTGCFTNREVAGAAMVYRMNIDNGLVSPDQATVRRHHMCPAWCGTHGASTRIIAAD